MSTSARFRGWEGSSVHNNLIIKKTYTFGGWGCCAHPPSLKFPPCRCAMSRRWLRWGGGSVATTAAATLVVVVAVDVDLGDR